MVVPFHPTSPADIVTVAQTIWGEARGESHVGRQAVADVIGNRARIAWSHMQDRGGPHVLYGDGTLSGVCLAHWRDTWQFTCRSPNDPNHVHLVALTAADPVYADCLEIAQALAAGTLPDLTAGATNYLNKPLTIRQYGHLPGWVSAMTQTVTIGNHTFYRG